MGLSTCRPGVALNAYLVGQTARLTLFTSWDCVPLDLDPPPNLISSMKDFKRQSKVTVTEVDPSTDHDRWRLRDDRGRQTWHYLWSDEEVKEWSQSLADRYHLGLSLVICPYPRHSHRL